MYNVGSIFRTADAAGVEKIYLVGTTPAPLDRFGALRPHIAKVALGAETTVPWEKHQAVGKVIRSLKKSGYRIFAIEQSHKSIPYHKIGALDAKKIALVVGNEVRGIPDSILKQCDKILEIPMRGALTRHSRHPRVTGKGKESLNVSVAFGIVAFQCIKHART
jgi:tRNA G18 (ribose-2'-O)-methylase SpoU